ncbi:MAG: hypothetical protein GY753_01345, partial [Gammaproteobacteria bacterium]|nr:hypothetical protein [Gammaproteobacteria bacterium]
MNSDSHIKKDIVLYILIVASLLLNTVSPLLAAPPQKHMLAEREPARTLLWLPLVSATMPVPMTGEGEGPERVPVMEMAPIAWQEIEGEQVAVEVQFDVANSGKVGFSLGNYNPAHTLIIDPTLDFSTYLGNTATDYAQSVATDTDGNAEDELWVTQAEGGLLQTLDGRVQVLVPPDAVMQRTLIRYRVAAEDAAPAENVLAMIALEAEDELGQEVGEFAKPLKITYIFETEAFPSAANGELTLAYWDEEETQWQALPTLVDQAGQRLQAETAHFSLFGVLLVSEEEEGQVTGLLAPSILGAGPNQWTGDASYSYPLQTMPGRGGLQPALSLYYNGGALNDMIRLNGESGHDIQAGFAGLGWSVGGLGSISKVDGEYYLSFPGGAYKLVQEEGTWHTAPESYLRIRREAANGGPTTWEAIRSGCSSPTPFLGQAAIRYKDTAQWTVWTAEGTRYTFGSALNSRDNKPLSGGATPYSWGGGLQCGSTCYANQGDHDCGGSVKATAYQWHLVRIEDNAGNDIEIDYAGRKRTIEGATNRCSSIYSVINGKQYVHESYPTSLSYGANSVEFAVVDRSDGPDIGKTNCVNQRVYRDKALSSVSINADGAEIRRYELTSSEQTHQTHLQLDSVQLLGALGERLPVTTTFGYAATGNGANTRFLQTVDNGYGGVATLKYASEDAHIDDPWPGNECEQDERYVVSEREVADGMGNTTLWRYDYGEGASVKTCQSGDHYEFLGFDEVVETLYAENEPNTVLRQTSSRFYQKEGSEADIRKGKLMEQVIGDGVTTLQQTIWEWTAEADWPRLDSTTTSLYDKDGLNPVSQQTRYEYNSSQQGGGQYGNVTDEKVYDGDGALYRHISRDYYPADDIANNRYIVNRIAEEKLLDSSGVCQGQSRMLYDNASGHNSYTSPPSDGFLHEVWHAGYGQSAGAGCDTNWLRQSLLSYSDSGNLESETTANGSVTTTTYDSTFDTYPTGTTVTPGPGGGVTLATQYRYYGINQAVGGSGLVGQLQEIEDANGAITRSSYDAFGRLTELRRPGADFSHPATETYAYSDTSPFQVKHGLRDDNNGDAHPSATYLYDWIYHNGLGQALQTQVEADLSGVSGQHTVVDNDYDAMGRLEWQSIPYAITPLDESYHTPQTQPKTEYEYDSLGRAIAVTHTDNSSTRICYNNTQMATIAPNGRLSLSERDSLGRLISAKQFEGDYSSTPCDALNWQASAYAEATYAYDVFDRVRDVWGPDANGDAALHTQIDYDALGRKTAMNDPDMGSWSYAYDSAGNLTRQTDATDNTLCYEYDGLNRLRYLRQDLAGGDCQWDWSQPDVEFRWLASHTYDDDSGGNKGIGRRTNLTDRSGNTAWQYDKRGRVLESVKIISAQPFSSTSSYDSADRLTTLTYPDPDPDDGDDSERETVSYSYNSQSLPDSVTGDNTYVQSTTYDEAGRIDVRTLGANLSSDYGYYAWDSNPGRGRLHTILSKNSSSGEQYQDLFYFYDAGGNIKQISDWRDPPFNYDTQRFGYDDLNRVITTTVVSNWAGNYNESFSYDADGNLTRKGDPDDPTDGQYSYNDSDHPHAASNYRHLRYCYDANGNATVRLAGGILYALQYDPENRLSVVSVM